MKYYLLFEMMLLLSISNTACTQNVERYLGMFTNNELGLSLDVKKSGENFSGFFEFQKQRYAFIGQNRNGVLQAEYGYDGKKIPFSLSMAQNVYYLTSEGHTIEMRRTSSNTPPIAAASKLNKPEQTNKPLPALSGQNIADPYGNYSFILPSDWTAKEAQGSFTISRGGDKVVYNLVPHNFNQQQLLTGLEDVVDQSTSTDIRITGRENVPGGVLVHFEGVANGKAVIVKILSALSPYGGGLSFIVSGLPENYLEKHTELLRTMAASVRFSKTKTSLASQEWISKIGGRQLLYLNTSGGGSTRITLNLYANGQFDFSNNSSYLSGGSTVLSYAGKDSNSGTWKILSRNNQTVLVLYGGDRSAVEYILTPRSANGEINLNDRRYFIKTMN